MREIVIKNYGWAFGSIIVYVVFSFLSLSVVIVMALIIDWDDFWKLRANGDNVEAVMLSGMFLIIAFVSARSVFREIFSVRLVPAGLYKGSTRLQSESLYMVIRYLLHKRTIPFRNIPVVSFEYTNNPGVPNPSEDTLYMHFRHGWRKKLANIVVDKKQRDEITKLLRECQHGHKIVKAIRQTNEELGEDEDE